MDRLGKSATRRKATNRAEERFAYVMLCLGAWMTVWYAIKKDDYIAGFAGVCMAYIGGKLLERLND